MYGIELLIEEHQNILKFTDYINQMCCSIIEGQEVNVEAFRECLDFGRNYADHQHHGKEEKILFRIMLEKLGPVAEKLIRHGMLVEHDLGRFHISELEEALNRYERKQSVQGKLDIITHAAGYASLLKRHIEKEDGAVYTFAERMLSEDDKKLVNEETKQFEEEASNNHIQEKYTEMLKAWRL